jgi:hypothetical protein
VRIDRGRRERKRNWFSNIIKEKKKKKKNKRKPFFSPNRRTKGMSSKCVKNVILYTPFPKK